MTQDTLFDRHRMVMNGRRDVDVVGGWRTHSESMQVMSGAMHKPIIHYEAPPSDQASVEMQAFITWFNGSRHLPAMTLAGVAHLHFVCLHPFEDGNGRVGCALAETSLAQNLRKPSLIALSQTISKGRKRYCDALHGANRSVRNGAPPSAQTQCKLECKSNENAVFDQRIFVRAGRSRGTPIPDFP